MIDTQPLQGHTYPHQTDPEGMVTDDHLRADFNQHPEAYHDALHPHIARFLERREEDKEALGDRVVERIAEAIGEMQEEIAQEIHIQPTSPEATAATDYVLLRETEAAIDSDTSSQEEANLAVLVASASETAGKRQSQEENPLHALERDGYGKFIAASIESLEQADVHIPGSDELMADMLVAELQTDRIMPGEQFARPKDKLANNIDESLTEQAKQRLNVPEAMHFAVIKDTSERREADRMATLDEGVHKDWQEQVFGDESIAELRRDVVTSFEVPTEQRRGQELVDYHTGKERRPIMDITLDEHSRALVEQEIEKRSAGLDRALEVIADMVKQPENRLQRNGDVRFDVYVDALRDLGVWHRPHGKLLGEDSAVGDRAGARYLQNMAGTVAELYIDETDLAKYRQLDAMINEATGRSINSTELLADGVMNLAAHTFPSGVEMMHALPEDSLDAVIRQGSLSTRSQVMHGVQRRTELNGGFIHMTGPGTTAYEYAKNDSRPTVVGVPIDTVIKHSPYMHLESSYIGNKFKRAGDDQASSMQYEMSSMQINDIQSAPAVFRAALGQMHRGIENGLKHSNIYRGTYNNISFAASSEQNTAGAYRYPIEDVSVYSENYSKILELVNKYPDMSRTLLDRATVVMDGGAGNVGGRPLSEVVLPNFDLVANQPIKVYAPMSAIEVGFTENDVGNSFDTSNIEYTFENIVPGTETRFMSQLVENGYPADEVLARSINAVNTKGDLVGRLLESFGKDRQIFEEAGVTIGNIVDGLSTDKLKEIFIPFRELDDNEYHFKYPFTDAAFVKAFGDKLSAVAPEYFAGRADALEAAGYELTDAQRVLVEEAKVRRREQAAQHFEIPTFDGMKF